MGGGTTPSLGLFREVQSKVGGVSIMVLIRPRTGDFLYSDDELRVILEDIRVFKHAGARGVVIGALAKDGTVDLEYLKRVVDEALPLEICFHRAFDMTRDADEALHDIESVGGVSRILTSGQGKSAPDALETLKSLFNTTKRIVGEEPWGLSINPGSGINATTVESILHTLLPLGLREIHLSGASWVESSMVHRREGMGMGVGGQGEWGVWTTSERCIREVRDIVDARWKAQNFGVEEN
ncbi:copper homeostasis CutC domain-containing protein [Collybia nuda]|uniref:Copper homeostasis protein cutC homolog n=1 Tax=Collybia nuda TaxID=64659 RepID=A0A9P6CQ38_9AGAR|nr:copper homeostasis CutC domain-containing protein [Collybia nuda]